MQKQKGQSFIELLIAIGICAILLPALLSGFIGSREGKAQQSQRLEALGLLKEAQEATRVVREKGWNAFAVNGTYHPQIVSNTWRLTDNSETINEYIRQIVVSDTLRDANGNIASSGGTLDPSTKKVVSTVSWATPFPSSVSSTQFISRYISNTIYTQTSASDFNTGTKSGVLVTNTNGGEVTLTNGGADWCNPNLSIIPLDLPGQGITTAISATPSSTLDYAYTTTGGNASGDSMDAVSITHDASPVAKNQGSYDNYKSYGIYVDTPNQYVYLTSDHPGLTVDIVQVANKPFSQLGTYQASGGEAGNSVFTSFNPSYGQYVGYVTAGNTLYTFDLTTRSGSRPELGHALLAGTGKKIIVVGRYAYVAISNTTEQLDIFDVNDPRNPTKVSQIDVKNAQAGVDLQVNDAGSRVYLVTGQTTPSVSDFFIINTLNKTATLPNPIATYNTTTMNPTGVDVSATRAIIVGSQGEQYKVLDISDETNPQRCGGLTNPNGATAINAVTVIKRDNGKVYSYILTNTASAELQLIEGGGGGERIFKYNSSGTYESASFNASSDASFNRFDFTVSKPSLTDIKFQLGIQHKNSVTNDCGNVSFSYVGTDGTSSTYFATPSAIPLSTASVGFVNPGQCFRYKAFLSTTDQATTPILYDATANYSP